VNPFEEDFSTTEVGELDRLAAELRSAVPPVALSGDFHDQLSQRLTKSWSFRSAMDRNPLMRAAAGLLMISLIAAPVAALVTLLRPVEEAPPTLGFDALPEFTDQERTSWKSGEEGSGYAIVGPEDEFDLSQEPWSSSRLRALEQVNRISLAGASLRATSGDQASVEGNHHALWSLFLESCMSGTAIAPDDVLKKQIDMLAAGQIDEDSAKTARAAWHWVLTGATTSADQAPLAWEGAPFLD
jgi:hypothetical protein